MLDLEETPTVDSYRFSDGDERWYGNWKYCISGYMIANTAWRRYGKKLTAEEVEAIVSDVDEKIDIHVWDLILDCMDEREG